MDRQAGKSSYAEYNGNTKSTEVRGPYFGMSTVLLSLNLSLYTGCTNMCADTGTLFKLPDSSWIVFKIFGTFGFVDVFPESLSKYLCLLRAILCKGYPSELLLIKCCHHLIGWSKPPIWPITIAPNCNWTYVNFSSVVSNIQLNFNECLADEGCVLVRL